MADEARVAAVVAAAGGEVAPEGVTAHLNLAAVERLAGGEPAWLQARRRAAWEVYERTPMPTRKLEEWRYTDLRKKLKLDRLEFGGRGGAAERAGDHADGSRVPLTQPSTNGKGGSLPAPLVRAMAEDAERSGRVVIVDGAVVSVELDPELRRSGVVLASLASAVREHGALLEKLLATEALPPEAGKFQALSAALWTDGVFLHVPKGVRLEHPVRVSRWISKPGAAFFSRTLIVAEPLSRVSYVDEILSPDFEAQTLAASGVEVLARDGAQLQYVSLQRMGRGTFHLSQQRTLAGKDATLDTLNVSLGASIARVDLSADLRGQGANSDMLGLYFGDEDQHFDHNTRQDHVAPNAKSDLLYKGALDGRSRAVFRGVIRVHPGAQRTDAYQTNRNLLLSEHARAESLPNLEIEADDVKCSHGATVGQLEAEHVFYLMSRGLSRSQAERLVVLGFLGEVLSRLPLGGVTEKVTRIIEGRLQGGRLRDGRLEDGRLDDERLEPAPAGEVVGQRHG